MDPNISRAKLAEKIQNNITHSIIDKKLDSQNESLLNQGINNYITNENPTILTKLVQQVKAIRDSILHGKFISREEYQKDKIYRQIVKLKEALNISTDSLPRKRHHPHSQKLERRQSR